MVSEKGEETRPDPNLSDYVGSQTLLQRVQQVVSEFPRTSVERCTGKQRRAKSRTFRTC